MDFRIASYGNRSILTRWAAPDDDGGASITAYRVIVDSGTPVNVGLVFEYEFTNLPLNAESLYVEARNSEGWGDHAYLDIENLVYTLSQPPTGLTFTTTSTTITASWDAPSDTGGRPIIRYEVSIDDEEWISAGTAREYTFTGLDAYTEHRIRVRVITEIGASGDISHTARTDGIAPAWSGTFNYNLTGGTQWTLDLDTLVSGAPAPDIIFHRDGYNRAASEDQSITTGLYRGADANSDSFVVLDDSGDEFVRIYNKSWVLQSTITIGSAFWRGVVATDTYVYALDNGNNRLAAWTLAGVRTTSADISLGTGSWFGATKNSTHILVYDRTQNMLRAWALSNSLRDPARDVSVGTTNYSSVFWDGERFFLASGDNFEAYSAGGTRQTSYDIDISSIGSVLGSFHDNGNIYAIDSTSYDVRVWEADYGLPEGSSYDEDTHVLTITATEDGTFTPEARAINVEGSVAQELTLVITTTRSAPVWSAAASYALTEHVEWTLDLDTIVNAHPAISEISVIRDGSYVRNVDFDETITDENWQGGTKTDTHYVFLDATYDTLRFWDLDWNRVSSRDISLGNGSYGGVAFADGHFFVADFGTHSLKAWTEAGTRATSRDIDVSVGGNVFEYGVAATDTHLLVTYFTNGGIRAWTHAGVRDTSQDVAQSVVPFGTYGAVAVTDTNIFLVNYLNNVIVALTLAGARDSSADISIPSAEDFRSIIFNDVDTLYLVDSGSTHVHAYSKDAGLPSGSDLDPTTNILTIQAGAHGTFTPTFRATNSEGSTDQELTLEVAENGAEWTTIPEEQIIPVGSAYSLNLRTYITNGSGAEPITVKTGYNLPTGVSLDEATGEVTANLSAALSDISEVVFVIDNAESNEVEFSTAMDASFDTFPTQTGAEGVQGSIDISPYINDGFPTGWTLSLDSASAQTWASLASDGTFTYTPPDAVEDTTYEFVFILTHPTASSMEVRATLYIDVPSVTNTQPSWNTVPDHLGAPGSTFSLNLNNFVNGDPDPAITLASGYTLPSGWTFVDGILSGTRGQVVNTETLRFVADNNVGAAATSGDVNIGTRTVGLLSGVSPESRASATNVHEGSGSHAVTTTGLVRVTWHAHEFATGYEARIRLAGSGTTWGPWVPTTNTYIEFSNVTNATDYVVQVRGVSGNFRGNITTRNIAFLFASITHLSSVGIRWTCPSGARATRVFYRRDRDADGNEGSWNPGSLNLSTTLTLYNFDPDDDDYTQISIQPGDADGRFGPRTTARYYDT